ncbi:MAG: tetratricopeptide repeat protein [Nannocystales bacterium]
MLAPIALALLFSPPPTESEPKQPPSSSSVEQSIELASDSEAEALYEAGVRAFEHGDFEKALSAFDASLQVEVSPRALYSRAQTHNHLGRCELAVSDYQRVIELLPVDHPAQQPTRDAVLHCARRMKDPQGTGEPPPRRLVLQEPKPLATGDDPGTHLRRGGTAALILAPIPIAIGIAVGQRHIDDLFFFNRRIEDDQESFDSECTGTVQDNDRCTSYQLSISEREEYAKRARRRAALWLGTGLGLGAAGITAGILLRREGKRRSKRWRNGMASLTLLPTSHGAVLSGRF